ncbi:MAG: OPT/YSL family transporter [Promethearchaeota archaeon]
MAEIDTSPENNETIEEQEGSEEELLPTFREDPKWKSGASWRVGLAIIYGTIVLQPASIWLSWTVGLQPWQLISSFEYSAILLFATLAARSGKDLSRQEAFVLFSNVGTTIVEALAANLIFFYYFTRKSPAALQWGFSFEGANPAPDWFAPIVDIGRTFLDIAWIPSILLWIIIFGILVKLVDLSVGFLAYQLFVVEERLPFPGAQVWANACITITEKAKMPRKGRVLVFSSMIGIAFSLIFHATWILTGSPLLINPWMDMTGVLESVGMEGASFGLLLDLILFAGGFVMPFKMAFSIFIGGFIGYFVTGILIRQNFANLGYLYPWRSGGYFDASRIFEFLLLRIWLSPILGLAIGAGMVPIIRNRKKIIDGLKKLRDIKDIRERTDMIPLWLIITMFLMGTGGSILITLILVPELLYLIWLLILLSVVWTFFYNIVNARIIGESWVGLNIPYLTQGAYYAVNYSGYKAFFAPLLVGGGGGAGQGGIAPAGYGWASVFKACRMTETDIKSYLKIYFFTFPLTMLVSFLWVQVFWQFSDIPSQLFSYTADYWPVWARTTLIWPYLALNPAQQEFQLIHLDWLGLAFILGFTLTWVISVFALPFEMVGLTIGLAQPILFSSITFLGALFGKLMERIKGKEWWGENKNVIAAGFGLGEGLTIAIFAAIALIFKAMWIWPI